MRSLRARVFAVIGLTVALTLVVTIGVGALLVRHSVERTVQARLDRIADILAARIAAAAPADPRIVLPASRVLARQGVDLVVAGPGGGQPPPVQSAVDSGRPFDGEVQVQGSTFIYVVRPAGTQAVVLSRATGLGTPDWTTVVRRLVWAGLIGLALAAAASLLLARTISRPVRRVADATRRLAAGESPGPVPVEGSDELGVLAASFNDMSAQLARAREAGQSFLLSVSHELKTPLTAIRGYAEALHEGALPGPEAGEVITAESARLERLVQDLLDLARMNRRTFAVRRQAVDLAEVVREAVRRYESRAEQYGVSLRANAPSEAPAGADPDRTLQVVSNLVENAIRSTPAGGSVTVVARPGRVTVRDTGPGLGPEEVSRAFERFFLHRRYGGERAVGTGLGLAIVKELTEAMGGSVGVRSTPGDGTEFFLELPASSGDLGGGQEVPSASL